MRALLSCGKTFSSPATAFFLRVLVALGVHLAPQHDGLAVGAALHRQVGGQPQQVRRRAGHSGGLAVPGRRLQRVLRLRPRAVLIREEGSQSREAPLPRVLPKALLQQLGAQFGPAGVHECERGELVGTQEVRAELRDEVGHGRHRRQLAGLHILAVVLHHVEVVGVGDGGAEAGREVQEELRRRHERLRAGRRSGRPRCLIGHDADGAGRDGQHRDQPPQHLRTPCA